MTLSRALSLSCLLGLASCFADAKEGPTAPRVIDDARGDAWTDGAEHLGELTYGETREGEFRGQPYLAYEFRARAGDTVTIELTAVDDAADPVLFLYAPAREENGERERIAENDDIAYPDNLSSRIASFELGLAGDYLIVFRDYQGRAGLSYSLELSCEGDSCGGEPSELQLLVTELGSQCDERSPGTVCGIAVQHLGTGERAHWNGDRPFVSASSAKFFWVAAALYYGAAIDDVEPQAIPIFERSDNYATGAVIDMLSSPDAVNGFYWEVVGMRGSGFCSWNYGHTREAGTCPGTMDDDNFTTANDSVLFLSQVWDGTLLGEEARRGILDWSTRSPRSGFGGWIPAQLPEEVRASVHHKSGSLPPDTVPGYSTSNDIGVVELPGGEAYAIALLMTDVGSTTTDRYG